MGKSEPPEPVSDTGRWSLRTRLIVLLLVATAGLWALAAYAVYREAEYESRELFDESLKEAAYLLLTVVQHEMAEHGLDYTAQLIDAADIPGVHYLRFQVWGRQGQLIYRSHDAPLQPLVNTNADGYAWAGNDGESLRTYAAWSSNRLLQIQIAEPTGHRRAVIQRTLWRLALFGGLLLLLAAFLIWWIISRSFTPILWTSEAVAARTGSNLDALDLQSVPHEIAPLIVAFNRLLHRIRATLERERRFTADAAHELRTPLAAIRAHAQVLQAARSADEASEAAQDIVIGVDRSRRLVDQLLILARLDGNERQIEHPSIDLATLVAQQVNEHCNVARQRHIVLQAITQSAMVNADADQLAILLRNLIDNALRHTPAGGAVQVACGVSNRVAWLAVRDSGVGIPDVERQAIFGRFYRVNRTASGESYGSGLGLSIVQRVAEQYGASISVEPGLNDTGVSFVVRFAPERVLRRHKRATES